MSETKSQARELLWFQGVRRRIIGSCLFFKTIFILYLLKNFATHHFFLLFYSFTYIITPRCSSHAAWNQENYDEYASKSLIKLFCYSNPEKKGTEKNLIVSGSFFLLVKFHIFLFIASFFKTIFLGR